MAPVNQMIDYYKIANAVSHYRSYGYEVKNVPWFVTPKAMKVTAPRGKKSCTSFLGDLVASGEQSFIQMWMNNELENGLWQCVTPCFRDENKIDSLHHNYFIKVELIELGFKDYKKPLNKMIKSAVDFFSGYVDVQVVDTDIGKDIVSNGIELGSYGYREFGDFKWVYGTGCAEPRLSQVLRTFDESYFLQTVGDQRI